MIKPASIGTLEGSSHAVLPPLPRSRFDAHPGAAHSPVELRLRHLRYFTDLLEAGYRQALRPDPLPKTLRADRIALGIDVPELDAVPLWSTTRADGAMAIPFVEFIMAQICGALKGIVDDAGPASGAIGEELMLARGTLRRVLEIASPGIAAIAPGLPRLGDIFLPRGVIDEICGPGGLLSEIVRQCEALLAVESVHPGH
jgi:hypothetical protein